MDEKMVDHNKEQDEILKEIKYVPRGDSLIQEYKPQRENKKPDTLFLYLIILIGLLPMVVGGSHFVWLSSAYASLVSNITDINPLHEPASTADISMIAGIPILVSLCAPLLFTKLSDKIGRKLFLQITALGMFLCNVALVYPNQAIHIIIFRGILCFCILAYIVIVSVYVNEICENHNKAKFMCIMGICLPLGNIYGYYLGPMFSYRIYTTLLAIPSIPFLVFFFFAPESPVYLLSKGKAEECLMSLTKLRRNKDLEELKTDLYHLSESLTATKSMNDKSILDLFKTRENRIATLLILLVSVAPQAYGVITIVTFLGPLLTQTGTQLSENTMTVSAMTFQIIGILGVSLFVEKAGRKTWLLWSCLGCGLSCLLWGLFYYLKINTFSFPYSLNWLPMFSVIIYMFSAGIGSIPMIILSDIFPPDLMSAAASFVVIAINSASFLIISSFPFALETLGFHWCFWLFSFFSLVAAVFISLFLPETKGTTVIEIQKVLKNYAMR